MAKEFCSKKINVLVVEDDEDDFILTNALLSEIREDKFEPEWVSTYEDALERIGNDHFDVCLMDYRLGQRDGLELLRHARELGSNAPVILLTGQGDPEIDILAMKYGASDYLIKGQINAANLERSIRYAIQQKQIEEERISLVRAQEAQTQAEAANKAKDEFLAMVSHELRTPLNSLIGWVSILRGNKGDEDIYERAIDAIERSARAQSKLVNDLLDMTRIASGNLWVERQPVPLVPIIEAAIDEAYPAANAKSIDLTVNLDHSVGLVSGDQLRLTQVINNLLTNAVKFTPEGGRISVMLDRLDSSARITVSDTGIGISPEFLPHVFDRYSQDKYTTDRKAGLGLGMAITKHIVELHGGTIKADSPGEGHGATFTVILPLLSNS